MELKISENIINDNNQNHWGPSTNIPAHFQNIPYAPFSKSDRIGKIADWVSPQDESFDLKKTEESRFRRRFGPSIEAFGTGLASAFAYQISAEDEADFAIVDRAQAVSKKTTGFKNTKNTGATWARQGPATSKKDGDSWNKQPYTRSKGYDNKNIRLREMSVKVGPEWKLIEEIEFPRLQKLYYQVEDPTDIAFHGKLCFYNKEFDKITSKIEKPLHSSEKIFQNVTTIEDPVLQKIAKETTKPTVFATDNIISTLMTASRSVYSWDIIITKDGNNLYFDKREKTTFDYISVNENATEPPSEDKDSMNSSIALSMEASFVNRSFSQQVLLENETVEFSKPNPFQELASATESIATTGYRYRKWNLGESLSMVLRTHIDAAIKVPNAPILSQEMKSSHKTTETQFLSVKTLLEYDSRISNTPDWRHKLDAMKGAVLAAEFKNNGVKLLKWTLESILSGSDHMRIGFISRASPKDRKKHGIVGTGIFKPEDMASQMNYDIGSGWGIVKTISDLCMNELEDGKYILQKDANKPVMRLYGIPMNAFDIDESGTEENPEMEE